MKRSNVVGTVPPPEAGRGTWKAFLHFSKPGARKGLPWTVHYRGTCWPAARVEIRTRRVGTEWKPGSTRGVRAVVVAWAKSLTYEQGPGRSRTLVLR